MDFERHVNVQVGVASEPDGRKATIAKSVDNPESPIFECISEMNGMKSAFLVTFNILDDIG
jgi:hypothetical protein